MGKTKTAFVGGIEEEIKKPSYDKAAKEAKRQARIDAAKKTEKKSKKKEEPVKVHISGLKGGQRVKVVGGEIPESELTLTKTEEITKTTSTKVPTKIQKVRVRGKKYLNLKAKIDRNKFYSLEDAIKLVKETSYSKFDGTVELILIVKKKGISTNISLPFSYGKEKRVEFTNEKTLAKLKSGKIDFDVLLATPDTMPSLISFAKILGPKGLMPNPKNGTIIKNIKEKEKFQGNSLNLKSEKDQPIVHTICGKVSQKNEELKANIEAIFEGIGKVQLFKAYLKATMGPSIKLQI